MLTIGSMYLILICAFASGIIFVLGTEEISANITFRPLTLSNTTNTSSYTVYPAGRQKTFIKTTSKESGPVPEFIDPVFVTTSSKRWFSVIENEYWACFHENRVYNFGHPSPPEIC